MRWYFCDTVFDPSGGMLGFGRYRPVIAEVLPGRSWRVIEDARAILPTVSTPSHGKLIVEADLIDSDHAVAIADARISAFPFEGADGTPLTLDSLVSEIPAAKRTTLRDRAEALHIPLHDVDGTWTVRRVLRRILRRLRLRRLLGANDYSELLNDTVSSIPVAKRNRILTALQAAGFSTAGITASTTIREALRILTEQNVDRLASEFD